MPKYHVTLLSYQDIFIEADSEEEARDIAFYKTSPEDWDDPVAGDLYVEEYEGNKIAFNQKEEMK
jgi:hypothetical protein